MNKKYIRKRCNSILYCYCGNDTQRRNLQLYWKLVLQRTDAAWWTWKTIFLSFPITCTCFQHVAFLLCFRLLYTCLTRTKRDKYLHSRPLKTSWNTRTDLHLQLWLHCSCRGWFGKFQGLEKYSTDYYSERIHKPIFKTRFSLDKTMWSM